MLRCSRVYFWLARALCSGSRNEEQERAHGARSLPFFRLQPASKQGKTIAINPLGLIRFLLIPVLPRERSWAGAESGAGGLCSAGEQRASSPRALPRPRIPAGSAGHGQERRSACAALPGDDNLIYG